MSLVVFANKNVVSLYPLFAHQNNLCHVFLACQVHLGHISRKFFPVMAIYMSYHFMILQFVNIVNMARKLQMYTFICSTMGSCLHIL